MRLGEILRAFFLPCVAVGLHKGFRSKESLVAWILALLGHIPGVVYALVKISATPGRAA